MVPVVVPSNEDLDPAQKQELVDRNTAVSSEKPGCTTLIEQHIHTRPGETVQKRPYRTLEARRKAVKQEVEAILRIGVIEESHSGWCSTIVFVTKPDGSLRSVMISGV